MATTQESNNERKLVGTRIGQVVSDKCSQTRKVEVTYRQKARKYGKYVRRRSVFHVHDPANDSHAGDTVEIAPCRPVSKTKSWRLVRVVERAPGAED